MDNDEDLIEQQSALVACSSSTHQDPPRSSVEKRQRAPSPLNFRQRDILAPMVRMNQLPFRLYCLEAGADLVYGPEVVDHSILACARSVRRRFCPSTGFGIDTVEFRRPSDNLHKDNLIYQTCQRERGLNVFQLGTNDAVRALAAASVVASDVAGIDVNMGCPKHFSVHGGMGAALLRDPERARDILGTLARNLSVPVSCKIRLLGSVEETVAFARMCEKAGASALTVHLRFTEDRPRVPAKWDMLQPVVDAVSIPVIANGDFWTQQDVDKIRAESSVSSVMVARGAIENPDVFRKYPPVPPPIAALRRIAELCVDTGTHIGNTKCILTRLFHEAKNFKYRFAQPPEHSWPEGFVPLSTAKFFDFLELSEALSYPELYQRKLLVDQQEISFST